MLCRFMIRTRESANHTRGKGACHLGPLRGNGRAQRLFLFGALVGVALPGVSAATSLGEPEEEDSYFSNLDMDRYVAAPLAEADGEPAIPVHGDLSLRYRGRWSASESRNDLLGYFGVDVGAAGTNPYSFHLRASARVDLGGGSDDFDGILQTFSNQSSGLVYDAYLDAHRISKLSVARVGRQTDYETPVVAIYDGARVESNPQGSAGLQVGGYGGRAVRYYDETNNDPLYGLYLKGKPWKGGRARIDWLHAEDETVFGSVSDDLFGLSVWQAFPSGLRLEGAYTRLESIDRDLRLLGTWLDQENDLQVRLSYYELLQAQSFNSTELDPFSYVLGVWQPFTQSALVASKGFGETFNLQGGIDLRNVNDSADEGTYNRDVNRYYLTANLLRLGDLGTGLSVTADLWQGGGRDISSWGADLTQPFGDRYEGALGTFYSLYKTDLVTGVEREDVRAYFARFHMDLSADTSFEIRYQFEQTDFEDYNDLRLRGTWRF